VAKAVLPRAASRVESNPRGGSGDRPLITVCICTYRRPVLLKRSLDALSRQNTGGDFTYDVVVADNDAEESARGAVAEFRASSFLKVTYCVQREQNIALVRNTAVATATGDLVAFIDDDEFPTPDWLATMLRALKQYQVDGILGPVRPHFDEAPPAWILRGRLCDRPEHDTGHVLHWSQTRTGNVLFRRAILSGAGEPFRREFGNGGEDDDFFRRMMARGYTFVWCNEGVVYEVVPPERTTRKYFLRRALLRGQNQERLLTLKSVATSIVAVPVYAAMLPFVSLRGHHVFMHVTIRLMDHAGKLCAAVGFKPITGKYLTG
jgi:succinoglycan biosynthesis protein ExoM